MATKPGSRADGAARGGNSKHSSSAAAVAAKDGEATVTAPPAPRSRASRPSSSSSGAADGSTKKVKSKEDGGKGGAAMASLGTEYAESLTFLLSHTSAVKGVGPKRAQQMEKLGRRRALCRVQERGDNGGGRGGGEWLHEVLTLSTRRISGDRDFFQVLFQKTSFLCA